MCSFCNCQQRNRQIHFIKMILSNVPTCLSVQLYRTVLSKFAHELSFTKFDNLLAHFPDNVFYDFLKPLTVTNLCQFMELFIRVVVVPEVRIIY